MVIYRIFLDLVKSIGIFILSLIALAVALFYMSIIPVPVFLAFMVIVAILGIYSYCVDARENCFAVYTKYGEVVVYSESEKIKENTNSHVQGFNGDWYYNTLYGFTSQIGDITSFDFKIIASSDPTMGLPPIPVRISAVLTKGNKVSAKYRYRKDGSLSVTRVRIINA